MSRTHYHTSGPAWAVRIDSDPLPRVVAPVQSSALDLPGEQKFGLVFLRKAGPESLASKIIARLNEQSIPFPTGRHWFELRREGYVTLETTGHRLTPKGNSAADTIMLDLARKYSTHHFIQRGGRGTGAGMTSRCTCGNFSSGPHMNTRGGESRVVSAEAAHMRDVARGIPVRRSLNDFLNEVAPPRFDLSAPVNSEARR